MTWCTVLTSRTSERSLNRSHISLHRVESYLASLAVKLFHYSSCDATLLKLALCHFLAVSARLKLGFWAIYKQPLLLQCVCLLVCFSHCEVAGSGIVALCGFSMVTKPPGPGRSRLNWALLVREGKLVLTRTPCSDTVLIALQQQKGLL